MLYSIAKQEITTSFAVTFVLYNIFNQIRMELCTYDKRLVFATNFSFS